MKMFILQHDAEIQMHSYITEAAQITNI